MERISELRIPLKIRSYFTLTKPGIIMGNAITATAGFALAAKGTGNISLFLLTLLGLSLIIASGCVCNNYIDRKVDAKMERTKNRALVKGTISPLQAILFAIFLLLIGSFFLFSVTNLLTLGIALLGFFIYVVIYSFVKYHSTYCTLIGSIAGAVPPVVGYCAVSNSFDLAAFLLFLIIATWQMPHFFAIAIYRIEDYKAAAIPILPLKKGFNRTKIQMLLYTIAFTIASLSLALFHYTGYLYLITLTFLGCTWTYLCIKGFRCQNDQLWARKMFFFSLIIVMAICIVLPLSIL